MAKGRPTRYTKTLGEKICNQIAEGKSLRTICNDDSMPDKATVLRWLARPSMKDFCDHYAQAKKESATAMAEDILEIANDAIEMVKEFEDNPKIAAALVQAHKIKADNLKWTMSKLNPKKYGDKVDITSGDKPLERAVTVFDMHAKPTPKKAAKAPTKPKKGK